MYAFCFVLFDVTRGGRERASCSFLHTYRAKLTLSITTVFFIPSIVRLRQKTSLQANLGISQESDSMFALLDAVW